ncbi:thymidine kinase [Priestia aryabhattai]|uniref:thymidine kinase n=1 Tax=Priestia aryabhattai TaxID=412384 RepID=UPI00203C0C55|nr:thymidine kinase [Priestia aryabhattai]MCM3639674.1 thymidine kinase [Priestia aryabhattai]
MPMLKPHLEVNVGGMFASKSTALLAQGKRHLLAGHKVLFIKPDIDNRYSEDEIVTHDGEKVEAIKLDTKAGIMGLDKFIKLHEADVLLFDEIQFFDLDIVTDIKFFLELGKAIYVSGLDMDYKGEPFNVTAYLMAIADKVNKLQAVCSECGDDSYITAKTSGTDARVELGSKDIYKPLCRTCNYKLLGVSE